jgi:cytoskeletal protein RodZ
MFDQIADELKNAREKQGLSLAQVANKSKIDIKFLEAMEQGDFSFLPDLYVRAFIKNFARTVGLNENRIFKKFEAAKQGIPYVEEETDYEEIVRRTSKIPKHETPQSPVVKEKRPNQTNKVDKKKNVTIAYDAVGSNNPNQDTAPSLRKRNMIIGGSLLGAIVLLTLIYFLFIDKGEQIIVVEKPIEDVIQQNQRYLEEDQTAEKNDAGIGASDSLLLTITASDTSWIRVSADSQPTEEFTLLPNSQKLLKAQTNYNITFGNSGAIKLQLNSKPLSFAGKSKSVLSVVVDKDGVKYSESSTPQR